jgi:hypothetical protein
MRAGFLATQLEVTKSVTGGAQLWHFWAVNDCDAQ